MDEKELRRIIESCDRMAKRINARFIVDPKRVAPLMNKSEVEVRQYLKKYFPGNVATKDPNP